MEIYLIRHTTPDIEKGICYGQTDLDLSDTFPEAFKTVSRHIPNRIDFSIQSSPLKRCAQLAQYLGTPVRFDDRLKELDFGSWEMQNWNDIPKGQLDPWMADFVNVKVTNGESYTELSARVRHYFETLKKPPGKQGYIIVTHAGPIRAFMASVLGIPLEKSFQIKIQYGDVFHLKKEEDAWKLHSKVELT